MSSYNRTALAWSALSLLGELEGALAPSSPLFQQQRHVFRQFRVEVHLLARLWMHKAEGLCVQSLSRTDFEAVANELLVAAAALAAQDFVAAIAFVAEERMPDVFHMGTYLVGASSFEDTFHESYVAEAFNHAIVGNRRFPDA